MIAAWEASGRATPASAAGGAGASSSVRPEVANQSSPPVAAASASASETNANPALDNLFRVFLVFQEMRSRGVRPDLRAYNALVNTCADLGEFDRALGVVRLMVDDEEGGGLQPDAVTYTSLIKAAARASPPRVEEAEEVGRWVGLMRQVGRLAGAREFRVCSLFRDDVAQRVVRLFFCFSLTKTSCFVSVLVRGSAV